MDIIKGHIIPKCINDKLVYTTRFTQSDAISLYNRYVEALKEYVNVYTSNGEMKIANSKELHEFLNALVFYIKSFTTLDIIPDGLFSNKVLPPSSSSFLRGYPLLDSTYNKDIFGSNDILQIIDFLETFVDNIKNRWDNVNRILNEIIWKREKNILEFPADTRPGHNTSSLLLHMFTVSAIATSIYQYRYKDGYSDEIEALRLVSLFHDIGKMYNWHKHEDVSSKALLDILTGFCEGEALEIVKKSSDIIKRKDKDNELYKIFKEADKLASSLDRLRELKEKLMPNGWKKIEACGKQYGTDYWDKWEFWSMFSIEEIEEFTREFCINASIINSRNPVFTLESYPITNDVIVARLDFQSIQSYIASNEIRVMNGASRMVDVITTVAIPFYLVKNGLVAESILYYGGGNLTLILPAGDKYEDILKKCKEYFGSGQIGVKLNYGYSYLYKNFANINRDIDRMLTQNKLINIGEKYTISPNIATLCKACGSNEVRYENTEEIKEDIKGMCHICRRKYKIGNKYHFGNRIEALEIASNEEKDLLLKNIIEYIAGHTIEDIRSSEYKEYKNIAYIKVDGNLMGQFIASSISITDAYERSIRIDSSLKRALHSFLFKLKNDEYVKRIVMGIMYVGGDDAALIVPTTIALSLSIFLINEYNRNMGRKSTLSIGIACGKPKHPIQLLKESSEYLLDLTKDEIRKYAYDVHSCVSGIVDFRGALSFWVADGGSLSREALSYMRSSLQEQGLTLQPYIIADEANNSLYRISDLLRVIIEDTPDGSDYVDALLKMLDGNSVGIQEEYDKTIRNVRRDLLQTLQVNIQGESDLTLKIIFARKRVAIKRIVILKRLTDMLFY